MPGGPSGFSVPRVQLRDQLITAQQSSADWHIGSPTSLASWRSGRETYLYAEVQLKNRLITSCHPKWILPPKDFSVSFKRITWLQYKLNTSYTSYYMLSKYPYYFKKNNIIFSSGKLESKGRLKATPRRLQQCQEAVSSSSMSWLQPPVSTISHTDDWPKE